MKYSSEMIIAPKLQLRLDLDTFVITGPTTSSTVPGNLLVLNGEANTAGVASGYVGQCLTDTFSVTNGGSSAPTICGTNSGEHSKHKLSFKSCLNRLTKNFVD